jgi:hypothetical protein
MNNCSLFDRMIGVARDRVKASAQVSMLRRANVRKPRENPSGKAQSSKRRSASRTKWMIGACSGA